VAGTVGRAVPDTEIKLINTDETGMGEIICRGPSLMLGYYENPEETEKTLVDGWLHTGDYGRFDEDGNLCLAGRKKNVIVTKNGKNIFPEEVEFYLAQEPYLGEALVHGIPDDKSGDIVIQAEIYPDYELIKEELGELTEEAIRRLIDQAVERANEQMPLYKHVRRFNVRKTEFTKTTTRKIKRYSAENFAEE